MSYRDVILSKTVDYVRTQKLASSNRGAIVMIDCPYCKFLKSAQIIQALSHIKCVHCSKMFTLIDLIRITENKLDSSEEDILNHVKNVLHLDVQTSKDGDDLSKLLASYSARNWALVPCAKASVIGYNGPKIFTGKEVLQSEWQKKENRKEEEWFHWISSGLNIGCFDQETEILTNSGWKFFKDLIGFELVATLNQKTNEIEYQKPYHAISYEYTGDMYCIKNTSLDMCITPNHNVFYQTSTGEKSKHLTRIDMINTDRLEIPLTGSWTGLSKELFYFPKSIPTGDIAIEYISMPIWLEFLGLFISKGNIGENDYRIEIHRTTQDTCKPIIELLNKLPYEFSSYDDRFCIHNKQLYYYLKYNCYSVTDHNKTLNKSVYCSYNKCVPKFVKQLSTTLISSIIKTLVLEGGQKTERCSTTSIKLMNDVQELYLKTGYSTIVNYIEPRSSMNVLVFEIIKHTCSFETVETKNVSVLPFSGKVYCVEVPNSIIYVRRNKKTYWSGNCRTGVVSNLTIIDFDLLTKTEKAELVKIDTSAVRKAEIMAKKVIPDEIKAIMGNTLIQESLGGFHAFYTYTSELRKTCFNYNGFHIDIENDLGQVIISPSNKIGVEEEYTEEGVTKKRIVGYAGRKFINEVPMISIPTEFLGWLQAHMKPSGKSNVIETIPFDDRDKDVNKVIKDSLNPEFKVKDIQSNRNNTLIALGGIFRKEMNIKQTGFVLNVLNKHVLLDPLPSSEIQHILVGLDKYVGYDETGLANDIVAYLKETDTASKQEIESAVFGQKTTSENKKRLDKTLMYLITEEKIIKKNRTDYKILQDMEWKTDLLGIGLPVDFKVPYFHDYAHFNWGDTILIGGTQKVGKTHLAINVLKRLVKAGITPRYLYNENGSRYAKIALQLGLKPGDFEMARCTNPADIIMRQKNTVYVYDWYRPTDFTKTADDFDRLADKLEKSQSLMFCFTQLREGNAKIGNQNDWFAKDQIRQFVAMSAKYIYDDAEGTNTYFSVDDVREPKNGGKRFKIPCKYIRESKEVKMLEELERGE